MPSGKLKARTSFSCRGGTKKPTATKKFYLADIRESPAGPKRKHSGHSICWIIKGGEDAPENLFFTVRGPDAFGVVSSPRYY